MRIRGLVADPVAAASVVDFVGDEHQHLPLALGRANTVRTDCSSGVKLRRPPVTSTAAHESGEHPPDITACPSAPQAWSPLISAGDTALETAAAR
jgi:hypothetical protein